MSNRPGEFENACLREIEQEPGTRFYFFPESQHLENHPLAVDIGDLQVQRFLTAQPRSCFAETREDQIDV